MHKKCNISLLRPLTDTEVETFSWACNETFFKTLKPDLISWTSANKYYIGSNVKETTISRKDFCTQVGEYKCYNYSININYLNLSVFLGRWGGLKYPREVRYT